MNRVYSNCNVGTQRGGEQIGGALADHGSSQTIKKPGK